MTNMRIILNRKDVLVKDVLVISGWVMMFFTITFSQSSISSPSNSSLGGKNDSASQLSCDNETFEKIADLSTEARLLQQRLMVDVRRGDHSDVILEAAKTKDKGLVPYLKKLLECKYSVSPLVVEVALVSLGESEYVDKTIGELKSKDTTVQSYAVWKLARFKTKDSYKKLYELLDDNTNRQGPVNDYTDYIIPPLSLVAMEELSSTVDDPPKDQYSVVAWKKWFENHKELIQ